MHELSELDGRTMVLTTGNNPDDDSMSLLDINNIAVD